MRLDFRRAGRLAFAGAALATVIVTAPARADIVGTLTCNIAGGVGVIIVSQRALSCTFQTSYGPIELYRGSISRLGVDIGTINGGQLVYQVVEAGQPAPGALAGAYVGPGFGVTIGAGGGLDGLVGGNGNSITLQPIAATTSTGLNINAGIGALQLAYAGPTRRAYRRHTARRHAPYGHHGYHHHHHM